MSNSLCQKRYWNMLVEVRLHVSYLRHYAAHAEWWDKAVNIFMAISSSGSIAAWAIWQQLVYVWPSIIALSQVVMAVKPFLPFKQRQKAVMALSDQIQSIALAVERDWYEVSEGDLSDKQIHDLIVKYRNLREDAEQTHLKEIILPRKAKLLTIAEHDTRQYFTSHYSTGDT